MGGTIFTSPRVVSLNMSVGPTGINFRSLYMYGIYSVMMKAQC